MHLWKNTCKQIWRTLLNLEERHYNGDENGEIIPLRKQLKHLNMASVQRFQFFPNLIYETKQI